MKPTNRKTTILGWVAGIAMILASADSPIAPMIPPQARQISTVVAMLATGLLGQKAQDADSNAKVKL